MRLGDLQDYFEGMALIWATGQGVAETSYYGTLERLLNAAGSSLKPKVRAVINLRNKGAGIPDGGLFSAEQFARGAEPIESQLPTRGVLEIKGPADEVAKIARSKQVLRYLEHYGQVLVTNYRDFALWVWEDGQAKPAEHYTISKTEAEFWQALHNSQALAAQHLERFAEFLKRVMLRWAGISSPADVAWFLASYARDAKARLESGPQASLETVRKALSEALDLKFEGEKGLAVFRSTLVQTLFYGLFSAWVLHHQSGSRDPFNWKNAAWELHLPIIAKLYSEIASPGVVRPLGLAEVLDWATETLNSVQAETFFQKFEQERAVQYFYEPFLEAYDPELRRQFGVWYTPPEVVRYMVERTDRALREELGLELGLADESVYILDPCTGTGSFLLEVVRRIARTQGEAGLSDALSGSDLKAAVLNRVFGFEIMPAPYVVAHMQMGLLLSELDSGLEPGERAGVYLTNALTGWEPAEGAKKQFLFPELGAERDAAEAVKQGKRILVVLGNPPYNSFAGIAVSEERGLSNAYRTTKKASRPEGQGLNDLYIRFFRMAERGIVEGSGRGVICLISNYSWLDGLSHPGMRERYLEVFDTIAIDNLNGDKYKTGKLTPEGLPDPSIFSTPLNKEGIQVGTAIATLVRKPAHTPSSAVQFRNLWGTGKLAQLGAEAAGQPTVYESVAPSLELGLPFVPQKTADDYFNWPLLPELFPVSFPGVKTSRDDALVSIDKDVLEGRMQSYFDPETSDAELNLILSGLVDFDTLGTTRKGYQKRGMKSENLIKYFYRPFDTRYLYWEEGKLLDRPRPDYFKQVRSENVWLSAGQRNRKEDFYQPQFTTLLADHHIVESNVGMFPLYLYSDNSQVQGDMFSEPKSAKEPNLSAMARGYLSRLGADETLLFYHVLATLHAPAYRSENAGALRQDWPRVPLPGTLGALQASAALGRTVAALLDTENPKPPLPPEVRGLGLIAARGGGKLNLPGDLEVTAGWGHNTGGVTMPMKGRVEYRASDGDPRLGERVLDVYLNGTAYWRAVPERVWEYVIGGYQVVKKWLSYREKSVLGRALRPEEAREVTGMVQRIAALVLLEGELDANYGAVKG